MKRLKLPIRRPWIPYVILIISLLITILSTLYVLKNTEQLDRLRFESAVQDTQSNINNRIETYIALLRGASGVITAYPDITQEEFRSFVDRLTLSEKYPGIQGIGYIKRVKQENKEEFLQTQSEILGKEIKIWPENENSEYFPILYLEPTEFKNNEAALGFDVSSESIRKDALERARDTGTRAASKKVIIGQIINSPKKQPGFFIYVPIYETSAVPKTLQERRETLTGYVYAPFRADDLLVGILGNEAKLLINFQIYDGTKIDQKQLLHDSRLINTEKTAHYSPRYTTIRQIDIAGETWTINFANDAAFEKFSQRGLAPVILLGGFIVSFTLFLLSRSQYIARAQAEKAVFLLKHSEKELQKAIGLRDNFISIASHELKTPVTSLKVYTEVLLKNFSAKGESKATEYMQKMNRQIDKLTFLIQDLLDVSRLQAGKLAFREEAFQINDVINEAIDNMLTVSTSHKILLKGKAKKLVWGDKERISQVINNFLTNAMKYSPKADKIKVIVTEEKKGVQVAVQDFGIGIGDKHLKKIFTRFYRVTDTDEQTYPGLGMGLYICYEIIKRHGGDIKVFSKKGKGSTFSFLIPYEKQTK